MFTNLQEQTNEARFERAANRLRECTCMDDLNRVWENCQMLLDHLQECAVTEKGDMSLRLAKALVNVRDDVRIDIEMPRKNRRTP